MNKPQKQVVLTLSRGARELLHHLKRLEGVQGPERSLVGESRSALRQDGAEERKEHSDCSEEGRRVGEIVELADLRRHLTDKIIEAHRRWRDARVANNRFGAIEFGAVHDALVDLRADFDRMTEKRSDLSNA